MKRPPPPPARFPARAFTEWVVARIDLAVARQAEDPQVEWHEQQANYAAHTLAEALGVDIWEIAE